MDQSIIHEKEIYPDFVKGPLTEYRNQCTFDWRLMNLSLYGEECVRFKVIIKRHPKYQDRKTLQEPYLIKIIV